MRETNIWLNGVMGVVTGDALGCPVQFMTRRQIQEERGPVTGMEGYGTYNMPPGTWTDDSSMTLAALDSIRELGRIDPEDIMTRFVRWYEDGAYTPYGTAFDMGNTCSEAIEAFEQSRDVQTCGGSSVRSNGNGSLMRIMPACLFACEQGLEDDEAIKAVDAVSTLTHAHPRSRIGCGLYYFCVSEVLSGTGSLMQRLHRGLCRGFDFYWETTHTCRELYRYLRIRRLASFMAASEDEIKSSGYIVDSLEAAIWSLITTNSFEEALLKAVNLGDDTDTVGAIAGGLAGLYYGYEAIPQEWLAVIVRREWIEEMCRMRRA